ncbi:glycosyltransferase involved in cell wall biosynthesis [Actinokineospora baliensis]|uniref:glycosyltransferase n=1 Tax=Actinokineospora baliensis TaxID=547056 RepID=UPI00195B46C7|nr:glycosyltransferase family 2 protein [Actinokineospora baliensis]MBM7773099.1 glycosyltransferase involved in cell wall biosynthesis [Actinokineospora baliensis]
MDMDVVVPAHNEEFGITGCLDRLAESTQVNRVVVVANGCADRTAELARAHFSAPIVIEVEQPGKAGALNAGDAVCVDFPRAYIDADIELGGADLDALAHAAREPGVEASIPAARLDLTGASWLVRRYYAVWQRLPSVHSSSAGRGVYVLGRDAHERVFPLPADLISDDGYVSRLVPVRAVVDSARVTIAAPRDLRSLVRRRARVHSGNARIQQSSAAGTGLATVLGLVRTRQAYLLDAAVFVGVTLLARLWVSAHRGEVGWGTDHSSRTAVRA